MRLGKVRLALLSFVLRLGLPDVHIAHLLRCLLNFFLYSFNTTAAVRTGYDPIICRFVGVQWCTADKRMAQAANGPDFGRASEVAQAGS